MQIEQIRNATIIMDYAGKKFLVDPWLAPQGSNGTFKELGMQSEAICAEHNELAMPICALPKSVADILNGIDYYIVTHIHPDHIDMYPDGTVGKVLNHNTPVFVQNKEDGEVLKKSGFTDVQVMTENTQIGEITLIKTPALHGTKVPFLAERPADLFCNIKTKSRFMWLEIRFFMMKFKRFCNNISRKLLF